MHKRTNVVIDQSKLKKAKKISHYQTTREVVDFALARLIQTTQAMKEIKKLRGKVQFLPSYDYKESR